MEATMNRTDPMLLRYLADNARANQAVADALRTLTELPAVPGGYNIDTVRGEAMRHALTYQVISYALDSARTNVKVGITGTYIHAWTDGDALNTGVRLNAIANDLITFDKRKTINIPFVEFYLTNTAQIGKTLNLLVGKAGFWQGDQFSQGSIGPTQLSTNQALASAAVVTSTLSIGTVQGYGRKTVFVSATPSGSPGILTCRIGLSHSTASAYWYLEPIVFSDQMTSGAQYQMMEWDTESYRGELFLHAETGGVADTWTVNAWFMARK